MRRILLSTFASCLFLLGSSLLAQEGLNSARNALAESLPDVAATRVERYLADNPKLGTKEQSAALLLLGEAHARARKPKSALTALEKILDKDTTTTSTKNYWQGLALALQAETPSALAKFSQVNKESSYFEQALYNAIELETNRNETSKAFELLATLKAHNPQFLPTELALLEAHLHLASAKPAQAREALANIASDERLNPNIQLMLGRIELAATKTEPALAAFASVLTQETEPQLKALALLGRSDVFLTSKKPFEALEPLLIILADEPEDSFLDILHSRFESILNSDLSQSLLTEKLSAFVKPETLGEDGNYATSPKIFASYYLSQTLEAEASNKLLKEIIALMPKGPLAAKAQLALAQSALAEERIEEARQTLLSVREADPSSPLASQAADLSARLATQANDLEEAKELLQIASLHPNETFAEQALLNRAVLTLASEPNAPLSALTAKLSSQESKVTLQLERALALAQNKPSEGREALLQFTVQNPNSPGIAQARLALTEILLIDDQPDFTLIESQLDLLLPMTLDRTLSHQSFLLNHRLAVITNDWSQPVAWGVRHLKNFPEVENDPYFLLRLAESSFRDGDLNRARYLFTKTASLPSAGELRELALYFSARANLKLLTKEGTVEGLETLDNLIERSGPLATQSRLLKARTLLESQGKPEACLKALAGIPGKPGDQPEAALLSAEAYRELSANNPEYSEKAVSIYQRLLDDERTSYPLSNRIHYEMALTYRESGQENLAIAPCLQVIDLENKKPGEAEGEWDYYYRCGFEAIDILLKADHARAALIQAQKLAQTKGPGAEQARIRAEQIQLEHQVWTD